MRAFYILTLILLNNLSYAQKKFVYEDEYIEGLKGVCLSMSDDGYSYKNCGYINSKGVFIIPAKYHLIGNFDDEHYLYQFRNGNVIVFDGKEFGIINKQNKIIVPFGKYDFIKDGLENQYIVTREFINAEGYKTSNEAVVDLIGNIIIPYTNYWISIDSENRYYEIYKKDEVVKYNSKGEILKD